MPIYEYACPDCGHRFETMQKMSDDPVRDCPQCKAGNVKKLISATSFVLKGGGWYKDHYGLKSGGGSEGASGGASESSAPKADAAPSAPAAAVPAAAPAAAPSGGGSSTPASSS